MLRRKLRQASRQWRPNLVLLIATLALTATPSMAAPPASAPSTQAMPRVIDLPSFGARITLPEGWVRTKEGAPNTLFQAVKPENDKPSADGLIEMVIGNPSNSKDAPTLQAYAEVLARQTGMQLNPNAKVKMGGHEALELIGAPAPASVPADKGRLVLGRLAENAGHYYLIYQAASGNHPPRAAFDALAAGIVWLAPVRPADALAPRIALNAFPLAASGLICDMPDPFRIAKTPSDSEMLANTFDFAKGAMEAALTITVAQAAAKPDTEIYKELFGKRIEQMGWTAPVWTEQPNEHGITVLSTDLIQMKTEPPGKPPRRMQVVVALADDGRAATMAFDYPADAAEKYSTAVLRQMPASIRAGRVQVRSASTKP